MTDPRAKRILHTAAAVGHLTRAAQRRLGPTVERLSSELEAFDGFPAFASASGSTAVPAPFVAAGENASTSTTERAAIAPDERNDADTWAIGAGAVLDELLGYLQAAAHALEVVCRECDKRVPDLTDVDISRLRCATIQPGACSQWADPTRTDGLCCDHGRIVDSNERRGRRHRSLA